MGIDLCKRVTESSNAAELYLIVSPSAMCAPEEFAAQAFTTVSDTLAADNAKILHERIFGTPEGLRIAQRVRSQVCPELDDGAMPTCLVCRPGNSGIIAGIQLHAVRTDKTVEPVVIAGVAHGRKLCDGESLFLTLSNLSDDTSTAPTDQARAMFAKAESALKQYGGGFTAVTRTWIWLGNILSWYDDFNHVRNDFFAQVGAIGNSKLNRMPASTGIGLGPANGCKCSMDLAAVIGPDSPIEYLRATGKQKSPFEYGSAFSRAASAATPAGRTVYISGTASIDASGRTTNVDDPEAQIRDTVENVRTALHDMGCEDNDIVQLTAYAKSTDVEHIFNSLPESKSWPALTMVCDICRPDLLFEIEATAMKPAK